MSQKSCYSLQKYVSKEPEVSITEYSSTRIGGKTVHTVIREDENKNCLTKEEMIYNQSNQLIFLRYMDYQTQSITEIKPTFTNNEIYAIKTERDMSDRILKQGPVNSHFAYHGVVQIFKPHKIRLVEYNNGREIKDITHPMRSAFICIALASAAIGVFTCSLKQCSSQSRPIIPDTSHVRE